MGIEQLREQALALPLEERIALAQTLWESLEAASDPVEDESAFLEELKRRDEEMTNDPTSCHSHDEVMAEARRRLAC
jgi:putative addiction module component (TIGR02574 family)